MKRIVADNGAFYDVLDDAIHEQEDGHFYGQAVVNLLSQGVNVVSYHQVNEPTVFEPSNSLSGFGVGSGAPQFITTQTSTPSSGDFYFKLPEYYHYPKDASKTLKFHAFEKGTTSEPEVDNAEIKVSEETKSPREQLLKELHDKLNPFPKKASPKKTKAPSYHEWISRRGRKIDSSLGIETSEEKEDWPRRDEYDPCNEPDYEKEDFFAAIKRMKSL